MAKWPRLSISSTALYSVNVSTSIVYSTMASSFGIVNVEPDVCESVDVSTVFGAKCECGKFSLTMDALPIKTLTMGEIRQVVASGFKLSHGAPLKSISIATSTEVTPTKR